MTYFKGTICGVPVACAYLVIDGQFTEAGNVLGPLHQYQQLLLHGLAHIVSCCH